MGDVPISELTSNFVSKDVTSETEANIDDESSTNSIPDADINNKDLSGKAAGNVVAMKMADGEYGLAVAKGSAVDAGWTKLKSQTGATGAASATTDGGAGSDVTLTGGTGGEATATGDDGGAGGDVILTPGPGGASLDANVGAAGKVAVSGGMFHWNTAQVIAMNDAAVTLTLVPGTPSGTLMTSNILRVDPEGNTEILTLPPEADFIGMLVIVNTGGESITVNNDAAGTIDTVATTEFGMFFCDGTTWSGMNAA